MLFKPFAKTLPRKYAPPGRDVVFYLIWCGPVVLGNTAAEEGCTFKGGVGAAPATGRPSEKPHGRAFLRRHPMPWVRFFPLIAQTTGAWEAGAALLMMMSMIIRMLDS